MTNVTQLSGSEAKHLDSVANTNNSLQLEQAKPPLTTQFSFDTVLQEFSDWRANKKHVAAAIPEELWDKVFELAKLHPPTTLCSFFGINKAQYNKQKTLRASQAKPQVHKQESLQAAQR